MMILARKLCQGILTGLARRAGQAGRERQGIGAHSSAAGAGRGRLAARCGENACVCPSRQGAPLSHTSAGLWMSTK